MSNDDYWLPTVGITTEVIGHYAQYGLWAVVISIVLYLTWLTTSRSPLDYHAWLVRLQTLQGERRRLVHVNPMNLESEGGNVAPHRGTNNNNNVVSLSAAGSRDRDISEEHTTVLVIEGPSAIRSSPNGAGADRSNGTNNHNFRFNVPATTEGERSEDEGENITEIHRFLRSHADGPVATAATIALYNRRFTQGERSNQLLVSRLSMSVESEAEPSPDNVLISYDNLQSSAFVGNQSPNNSPRRNIIFETSDEDEITTPSAPNSADTASGTHQSNDENSPPSQSPSSESRLERAVADGPDVAIKLKFLDDSQKSVRTCLNVKVGEFKRHNFSDSLAEGKVIRLIFKGGLLRDDSRSLASYGLHDQCVLHCHIGSRPYSRREGDASNGGGQTETRTRPRRRLISPMSHILHSRIYWLDLLLVALFNVFARVWNWAQNEETADGGDFFPHPGAQGRETTSDTGATEQLQPSRPRIMYQRMRRTTRQFLRVLLNCLFDLNAQGSGDQAAMEDNQFNVGILLGFVFAMKFIALWTIVFYYPQFVDPKGVFMLSILTAFATFYFYCNRGTLVQVT